MPLLFTLSKTFAQNKPYSENLKWFPSLQIHNFDVLLELAAVGKLLRMPFLVGKNILDRYRSNTIKICIAFCNGTLCCIANTYLSSIIFEITL